MHLTPHDLRILRLASQDVEGRLTFFIADDGSIALRGNGEQETLPAEESLPKLDEWGLLSREVSRSYILTPEGWDAVKRGE